MSLTILVLQQSLGHSGVAPACFSDPFPVSLLLSSRVFHMLLFPFFSRAFSLQEAARKVQNAAEEKEEALARAGGEKKGKVYLSF